jgi:hypothetical protein
LTALQKWMKISNSPFLFLFVSGNMATLILCFLSSDGISCIFVHFRMFQQPECIVHFCLPWLFQCFHLYSVSLGLLAFV